MYLLTSTRLQWWIRNRRAQRIQRLMLRFKIQEITLTPYDLSVVFQHDKENEPWSLEEFAGGSPIKKGLHRIFGNYTGGALWRHDAH
jgi:hypothetical protein